MTPNDAAGHGFTLLSEHEIPLLSLRLQHYRHRSGAEHYHLATDDPHRAFIVAFRTIPEDDTGLPHILEHLVLCGSDRYPVRDPFFLMLRRSLSTFMNAMTGSDCTYYPFSSQVEKDFDNLLSIYLDAVFRPNLNALDFAQEGYRLEPAAAGQASSGGNGHGPNDPADWAFKGVVYNEMKGAMGNTDAQLFQHLGEKLAPDTPYRFNSGGDPRAIPSLGHEDLVAFHRAHYCAANACFSTYGDMDVEALHARFAPYLDESPGRAIPLPERQTRFQEPERLRFPVPLQEGQDPKDVSAATLAWLWGDTRSLDDVLLADLLEQLLLGHAGAPLRKAMESSGLGRALGFSGFSNLGADGLFAASLKGVDPADYDRFAPLILETLEAVRETGFSDAAVEAALHQLELDRRTISGDRFPFGLELSFRVTEAWREGSDARDALDQDEALAALRERVAAPGFWPARLDEIFLRNPHRVLLLAEPDGGWAERHDLAERAAVVARVEALDELARAALVTESRALEARQAEEDDPSVLPALALSDVPAARHWAEGRVADEGIELFEQGTNGLLHELVALPLGPLSERERDLLPLLVATIGKLGVAERGYAEQAERIHAQCGGLGAWVDLRVDATDPELVRGFLFAETRGLARRYADWSGLLAETFAAQRFDEVGRLRELVEQGIAGFQARVAWRANDLAQQAAMRGFGGRAGLSHRFSGLGRLAWLKALSGSATDETYADLGAELAALLARLRGQPLRLALVGDAAEEDGNARTLAAAWEGWRRPAAFEDAETRTPLPGPSDAPATAYVTASQVSYCGLAFPTTSMSHPDAAALSVAGRYLVNNFLHGRVREKGGAYGSRAAYQATMAAFVLSSYRDPRLDATYADMAEGLRWLAALKSDEETERLRREAILGAIGAVDRPASPAGEGRRRFVGDLVGYGPEVINAYRARLLAVTTEDLRRVAETWLDPARGAAAVVTGRDVVAGSDREWEVEAI